MGKVDENKRKKRLALLNAAYELFTTKGVSDTSISDIVTKAGVAKGTFYLYYTDKTNIKNMLVVYKTFELFNAAEQALKDEPIRGFENQVIFLIDHIIDALNADLKLLNFIAKSLVMGAMRTVSFAGNESRIVADEIYNRFMAMIDSDIVNYDDVNIMVFTVVELATSSAYNSILYNEPAPLGEYKPHLYRSLRAIIRSYQKQ